MGKGKAGLLGERHPSSMRRTWEEEHHKLLVSILLYVKVGIFSHPRNLGRGEHVGPGVIMIVR